MNFVELAKALLLIHGETVIPDEVVEAVAGRQVEFVKEGDGTRARLSIPR